MDEEKFGFHSEYYIAKNAINSDTKTFKGYFKYSDYKGKIYFLPVDYQIFSDLDLSGKIVEWDFKKREYTIISVNTSEPYKYIAVNQCGYYLYNEKSIALFGFDGNEIYSYQFEKKEPECIYIYADTIFFSDTRTKNMETSIYSVNMKTKEKNKLWGTEKENITFDQAFVNTYQEKWEKPLTPLSTWGKMSSIGNCACKYIYANENRIIAAYSRSKQGKDVVYIVNIDRNTQQWKLLDCSEIGKPDNIDIFSFDMLNDVMWIKADRIDEKNMLYKTKIDAVYRINKVSDRWCNTDTSQGFSNVIKYVYYDGNHYLIPELFELYKVNGENAKIEGVWEHDHGYQTDSLWMIEDFFIINNEYGTTVIRKLNDCGYGKEYEILRDDLEKNIDGVSEREIVDEKDFSIESNEIFNPTKSQKQNESFEFDFSDIDKEAKEQDTSKVCPNCGNILKENAKFCPECGTKVVKSCSSCGAPLEDGAKFCSQCGEKVEA